jgi:hypothetical protein
VAALTAVWDGSRGWGSGLPDGSEQNYLTQLVNEAHL